MTIRVVLVDDQVLIREALAALVGGMPGIEVVATAVDGEDALVQVERTRPDVVLLDLRMPRLDGIATTRLLRDRYPVLPVVVLTTYADDASIFGALRAGASGYLTKDAEPADIATALRRVCHGEPALSPEVQRSLVAVVRPDRRPDRTGVVEGQPAGPAALTAREREVLGLVAEGLRNGEIAARLHIAEATVKTHLNNLFPKIGSVDRAQAVAFAYRAGLVDPAGRRRLR